MTERKRTEWLARTIDEAARTITVQPMRQTADMDKPAAFGEPVVLRMDDCTEEVRGYAALHGMTQRLGDAAAQSAGTSIEAKLKDVRELADYYMGGATSWDRRATRTKVDPEAMLAKLLANDPEKLAAIIAAAQAAVDAKLANAKGASETPTE